MVQLELTDAKGDLEQIIELQRANHVSAIQAALWATDGFVTLEYDMEKLTVMKGKYKHVVARAKNKVVGYALVLLKEQQKYFPLLADMFTTIEAASFHGESLKQKTWFVMGQICVDKDYREQGLFRKLYQKLKEQMQQDFDLIVTEVSTKNIRSVNAHREIGFTKVEEAGGGSEEWDVIAWSIGDREQGTGGSKNTVVNF